MLDKVFSRECSSCFSNGLDHLGELQNTIMERHLEIALFIPWIYLLHVLTSRDLELLFHEWCVNIVHVLSINFEGTVFNLDIAWILLYLLDFLY